MAPVIDNITPPIVPPAAPWRVSGWTGEGRLRLTRAMCEMLDEAGMLPERWELLDGDIVVKMGQKNKHNLGVMRLVFWLARLFGEEQIRSQATMRLTTVEGETNQPEPDVAVIRSPTEEDRYLTAEEIILVVETSDTTLAQDMQFKKWLYARCGIAEYWVLDLNGRTLTVCRQPNSEAGAWDFERTYIETDDVATLAAPESSIRVAELLPRL